MKRAIVFILAMLFLAIPPAGCSPAQTPAEDGGYYTVSFDSRGGTAVESQRVRSGNPVRRPETPVREGYYLNGWYTDEGSENEWDFDADRVTENMTLYAGWPSQGEMAPTASLVYELNEAGDGYTVTEVGEETQIVVPPEHEGLPVTAIQGRNGTGAFARSAVTAAYIPDSIRTIGQNTFSNCSALAAVVISAGIGLAEIGM